MNATTTLAAARQLLIEATTASVERQCNEARAAIEAKGWKLEDFKAELLARQLPKLMAEAGL